MDHTWKQADVFPVIARLITTAHRENQQFVSSREIAERLLQDPEGQNLIQIASQQHEGQQSLEWFASNMVAWFSQRITVGESEWGGAFSRTKIDGLWAYKPIVSINAE